MNNTKDELLTCKRLKEIALSAYTKSICTYSDFMNLNELNLFFSIVKELPNVKYELFGGFEDAERKIIGFYNEDSFLKPDFLITCIHILPLNKKFSDTLSHRDFLGAILNLGIDRSKVGDILIKENEGFVFLDQKMSDFVINNLTKIKHTQVKCKVTQAELANIKPSFKEISKTVSSLRLDAMLSLVFNASRSSLTEYISSGKVFVNSKLIESNSYVLKNDDIVSVRGLGKFIYKETTNQTKKGRYYVTLQRYI